jgi:hypothetical protein
MQAVHKQPLNETIILMQTAIQALQLSSKHHYLQHHLVDSLHSLLFTLLCIIAFISLHHLACLHERVYLPITLRLVEIVMRVLDLSAWPAFHVLW